MDFDENQYDYFFSDSKFVQFLSNYFSSYETNLQNINASLFNQNDYEEFLAYIRVILANLKRFIELFQPLLSKVSYQYSKEHKVYKGQIKGKLLINYYVKEIANRNIPKNYHCLIKKKSYATPENIYIVFCLNEIIRRLKLCVNYIYELSLSKDNITELNLISNYLRILEDILNKHFFIECKEIVKSMYGTSGHKFPKDIRNLIERRIKLRKIINLEVYKEIILWLDKFSNNNSLSFIDDDTLNTIRYDGEPFTDKLFELWSLFKIKETFINEFDYIQENTEITFDGEPIFTCYNGAEKLKIYFQKGKNLYWNHSHHRKWSYIDGTSSKSLRGIPDISIVKETDEKSIVMIDVKNKIRKGGDNSEEIYKMIGYFSNFSDMINNYYNNSINKAVLIFRNDFDSFSEKITDHEKNLLLNISVSPKRDTELNDNQFKQICKYIIHNQ